MPSSRIRIIHDKCRDILKVTPVTALFSILLVWELTCRGFSIPEYILPPPSSVGTELIMRASIYGYHTLITAAESFAGFLCASIVAYGVGILFVLSTPVERAFYPYAIALKAVPIVAIAPLIIMWFGAGFLGKVVLSALVCFFPVIVGTVSGMKSINQDMSDLFYSLGADKSQILWKLRAPIAAPQLFAALKISATLSVVGSIVGELSGSLGGLGYIILIASYEVNTNRIMAAIICASMVGIIFFGLVAYIEKKVLAWHESIYSDEATVLRIANDDQQP